MRHTLPFLLLALSTLPAAAQLGTGGPGSAAGGVGVPNFGPKGAGQQRVKREPAPPALPGARAEPTAVTPAERSAADLPPTEALFDAINRGDLPTARDAVNRGADLNGTNVLGLTPLELAVDLGRNEISFLLLSLRGGGGFNTAREPAAPAAQPRAATARAERDAARAEREAARAAARESRAEATAIVARPPNARSPQAPHLFAGQGGSPIPQAGFLGFDAGR